MALFGVGRYVDLGVTLSSPKADVYPLRLNPPSGMCRCMQHMHMCVCHGYASQDSKLLHSCSCVRRLGPCQVVTLHHGQVQGIISGLCSQADCRAAAVVCQSRLHCVHCGIVWCTPTSAAPCLPPMLSPDKKRSHLRRTRFCACHGTGSDMGSLHGQQGR